MTSVTIRGTKYPTVKAAALAMGVQTAAVTKARLNGRLDAVGTGQGKARHVCYNAEADAEYILENIMHRRNWTVDVRDKLAAHLENRTRRNKI